VMKIKLALFSSLLIVFRMFGIVTNCEMLTIKIVEAVTMKLLIFQTIKNVSSALVDFLQCSSLIGWESEQENKPNVRTIVISQM
jgi:hypothetical protein